jgi:hypothetical protein
MPSPSRLPAGVLKARFDALLTDDVRPMLGARGFAKSGSTFTRRRGSLYDVINFQGSDVNGTGLLHRFYVNVGIGSTDVDAASVEPPTARPKLDRCLVQRRWADFVHGAPERTEIRPESDLDEVRESLLAQLAAVVTVLDTVATTDALVDLAIERNRLQQMQKTCAFLTAEGDLERLRRYVGTLRQAFGTDPRWAIFNDQLAAAAGPMAAGLRAKGLLDETVP